MKLLFLITILYFSSYTEAKTIGDDDVQRILEILWKALELIASKVHLDPDTGLSIEQFLTKYNYPLQSHNVTTSDKFILTLHRIPESRNENIKEVNADTIKPVVLFVHGLSSSSMDWIVPGPDTSLPLLLADLGYDVWLANLRGNLYSGHQTYTRKDSAFWDYSFHERGYYDLPAIIDYIITETTVETITYVGHSEGTTNGLVLTSSLPEYNEKINLMALLSPVAYMGNLTSPIVLALAENEKMFKLITTLLNVKGLSYSPLISLLVDVFCNDDSSVQDLCISALGLISGFDPNEVNRSTITVFFSHTPSGISIKEVDHYLQECTSGYFRQYDFGSSLANRLHYGSETPPSYDIKKVTVPLALYYAKNDYLSSILDVEKLILQLSGDTADRYLIEYEKFNHYDFLTARDVKKLLYDRVIETIKNHNPLN